MEYSYYIVLFRKHWKEKQSTHIQYKDMVLKYVSNPWLIDCLDTENNFCRYDSKNEKRKRTKELKALDWEL